MSVCSLNFNIPITLTGDPQSPSLQRQPPPPGIIACLCPMASKLLDLGLSCYLITVDVVDELMLLRHVPGRCILYLDGCNIHKEAVLRMQSSDFPFSEIDYQSSLCVI